MNTKCCAFLRILAAMGALISLGIGTAWAGGPWFVSPSGSDGNDCLSSGTACLTIGEAIRKASPGDTINVVAGIYNEKLTIEKSLVVLGPNVGIDPNTGSRVPEAIIDGGKAQLISGDGSVQVVSPIAGPVIFEGFTIQNAVIAQYDGDIDCIFIGPVTEPVTIRNNRFIGWTDLTAYDMGIYALGTAAGSHITVQNNEFTGTWTGTSFETPLGSVSILNNGFHNLNAADTYAARGVQIMTDNGNDTSELMAVNGNTFSGFNGVGIILYGGYPGSGEAKFTNVEIKDNTINCIGSGPENWHMGILLRNSAATLGGASAGGVHNVTISGNTIIGAGGADSYGSVLRGQNTNITIEFNNISTLAEGVAVEELVAGAGFASGVVVHRNSLTANTTAVSNQGPSTIDATCNWWGAANGPGLVGPGSGDPVSTNVTFTPFLRSSNLAGWCTVDPGTSTVTASPTSVVANGTTTSTITVTLMDSASNPVSGKTVTLAAGSGSSVISAASDPSDASGVVTFTVKDAVAETVTYTAHDTTDSVTLTPTAAVTFVPTYSVTYAGNGSTSGSVPTDGNAYLAGVTVTVLGNTGSLAKTGYTFAG